jgi:hypothetical protein
MPVAPQLAEHRKPCRATSRSKAGLCFHPIGGAAEIVVDHLDSRKSPVAALTRQRTAAPPKLETLGLHPGRFTKRGISTRKVAKCWLTGRPQQSAR